MENPISTTNKLNNNLFNLLVFHQKELQPYVYKYQLPFGISLNFTFDPDKIPHLIFGTVKGFRNSSQYKGQPAYDDIMTGKITSVPSNLRNAFKSKSRAFKSLPTLLDSPTIYHYNNNIVQSGNGCIKGFSSRIDADFLLHKNKVHLFLKWTGNAFVPNCLILNSSNTHVLNQLKMEILNDPSTFKCFRDQKITNLTSVI